MPSPDLPQVLVLASASAVRTRLLTNAGVPHLVAPADIDESAVREEMLAENTHHADIAEALAELKAQKVSPGHERALVLGSDQILSCGGELFEKPRDLDGVRGHLESLMAREHTLYTSACIVRDGAVVWHHNSQSRLRMRTLSDTFIEDYVSRVGEAACQSVGAYQLEGLGLQLFSRIDGDFFDILGLPMLPLLGFLRENGVIDT